MDFTKKDARTAAETATFCHLRDQDTGEYLYESDGKTAIGVMVVGAMARSVYGKKLEDARAKLQSAQGKGKKETEELVADTQKNLAEAAKNVTRGFIGVDRGDKPATLDDCEWFYDLNYISVKALLSPDESVWQDLSFSQQVLMHSNKAANYLGNA